MSRAVYPSLKDRLVVVSGGGSGIGAGFVEAFARQGARVVFLDIAEAESRALEAALADLSPAPVFHPCDLTDVAVLQACLAEVVASHGPIDVLINNAANDDRHSLVEVTPAYWDERIAVNLRHLYFAAQSVAPGMRGQGRGVIINMGSISWHLGLPDLSLYETAKAAVIGITRQMAAEFGPMGIRVNAILPGHMVTERLQTMWDENPSGLRFFEDQYPLRKVGRAKDIANGAVFLCSEEASFITGHSLVIDGGLSIQLQENFGVRQAHYLRENPETQLPY